jgi:hypothetical protein
LSLPAVRGVSSNRAMRKPAVYFDWNVRLPWT